MDTITLILSDPAYVLWTILAGLIVIAFPVLAFIARVVLYEARSGNVSAGLRRAAVRSALPVVVAVGLTYAVLAALVAPAALSGAGTIAGNIIYGSGWIAFFAVIFLGGAAGIGALTRRIAEPAV